MHYCAWMNFRLITRFFALEGFQKRDRCFQPLGHAAIYQWTTTQLIETSSQQHLCWKDNAVVVSQKW